MANRYFIVVLISLFILADGAWAQSTAPAKNAFLAVPQALQTKLGSGRIVKVFSDKLAKMNNSPMAKAPNALVAVYLAAYPSSADIAAMESRGLVCHLDTWTPPMDNHPLGFFLAELPADRLNDALALDCVHKLETSEGMSVPLNNYAARAIRATAAWACGWTGKGVKVGILDSGIHADSLDADLPVPYQKMDVSLYPTVTTGVTNHITGHGTHVAGIILGRGALSAANTANGGGSYKGMAPDASLAFYKIGDDTTANATDAAIIAAIDDAVKNAHVQVINMSYGGWGSYHDGSEADEQKVDWAYTQGVAVVMAAGNSAGAGLHVMGTVPAHGESDFIRVNIYNADSTKTRPSFNLVWFDSLGVHRNLTLKYYDTGKVEITSINRAPTTESPRGTESQFSSMQICAPNGNSIMYVKVANPSAVEQLYHVYEDYTNWTGTAGSINFSGASADYTIAQPALADHCLSAAAFVTRPAWTNVFGWMGKNWQTMGRIASFSSRGPRVDGRAKPDIAAPGSSLVSIRDKNIFLNPDGSTIDNDGAAGGPANYYVMQGTSMATPVTTGAVAVLLSKYPTLTPQQVYDSLCNHARTDVYTGVTPNMAFGAGKLDLGFMSGLTQPPASEGWIDVTGAWPYETVAALAVNAQGVAFANVGKGLANDSTSIFRSTDLGVTWSTVRRDVGLGPVAVNIDGALWTAVRFNGTLFRSGDNGGTWTTLGDPHDYTSIAFSPDGKTIYAATYGEGIVKSANNGATWAAASDGLPANAQVPILRAGPDGTLLALCNTANVLRVYRMAPGEAAWTLSDAGIDTTQNVNDCGFGPGGAAYAAIYDRVYRSGDRGASWTQTGIVSDYIQNIYAYSDTTLFVGTTGGGVYRSLDMGANWETFNDGITTLNMTGAFGSNRRGQLYAASNYQKIYRRAIGPRPPSVTLLLPANQASQVPVPTTLRWRKAANALAYRVQASEAQDFAITVLDVGGWRDTTLISGAFGSQKLYFWRVAAQNDGGSGDWSAVFNFTTAPPAPEAPTLTSPPDSAMNVVVSPSLTFKWDQVASASTYAIQIDSLITFAKPLIDVKNLPSSFRDVFGLHGNTTYYWRVNATNANGTGPWSAVWRFNTMTNPPSMSHLVYPPKNATNIPLSFSFTWDSTLLATAYRLEVSTSSTLSPAYIDEPALTDTSYLVQNLTPDTKYFWRVTGTNDGGQGVWSDTWSFTTIGIPVAPTLRLPVNNAANVTVAPAFRWDTLASAATYRFQIATDTGMTAIVRDTAGFGAPAYASTALALNTKYFWRVNATNEVGTGPWTSVWSFTTSKTSAVAPEALPPGYALGKNYPDPFTGLSIITYTVPARSHVVISLYDRRGRFVRALADDDAAPGAHAVRVDGATLPPGVYFYTMTAGGGRATRDMQIVR